MNNKLTDRLAYREELTRQMAAIANTKSGR